MAPNDGQEDDDALRGRAPLRGQRAKHGMKVVTRANWLAADRVALFTTGGLLDDEAGVVRLVETGNFLADRFAQVDVSPSVSEEAARLFHVGRGTVIYGVFFYPLFEVGLERAYSAVEVATKEAAIAHGIPRKKRRPHAERLAWLCDFGWMERAFCGELHDIRWLRNHAVHERQNIIGPHTVSRGLSRVAQALEKLAQVRDAEFPQHLVPGEPHDHFVRPWQ